MPPTVPTATRLGLHLALGALLLIASAWLFGAIAEDVVTGDRITLVDVAIAQWLHEHASAGLTRWMLLVTDLHSTIAVSCYSAIATICFVRKRQWRRLATLAVCMAGGLALNVAMKLAYHRARPVLDQPLLTLSSYSFPSGHTMNAVVFYGALALIIWSIYGRRAGALAVAATTELAGRSPA